MERRQLTCIDNTLNIFDGTQVTCILKLPKICIRLDIHHINDDKILNYIHLSLRQLIISSFDVSNRRINIEYNVDEQPTIINLNDIQIGNVRIYMELTLTWFHLVVDSLSLAHHFTACSYLLFTSVIRNGAWFSHVNMHFVK